jgi:DNA-binding transcriptional MerR regulator
LVQISFPNNSGGVTADSAFTSSFVTFLLRDGVQPCCISTCVTTTCAQTNGSAMGVVEQGRLNPSGTPLMTTLAIPDGAYTSRTQMGNELTYQANNTPPFNLITYETFRDIFMNTRDISILFNEPGDCFSSKTNNKRYGAHTKENIMTTYYTQQHIDSFPEITEVIAFNAYYYPILKELLATQRAKPFLNTGTFTFDTIMKLVMGTFEGLQSDIYYTIGQLNQNALDIFRRTLTFELRNINRYQWIYNEDTHKFITIHDTLHASLQNDIQKQYQTIGEVAKLFDLNTSHIRFWTKEFNIKVRTTRKGDRLYTRQQIEELKTIYHLVKEKGFTIPGAKTKLKELASQAQAPLDVKEALLKIKNKLQQLKSLV